MNLNIVIIMGRLTADPEFRQTASGTAVCRINVAVNRPKKKDAADTEADFISVTCWRETAEFVSRYFSKGSAIIVQGCLRNNNYTDQNGVKHYSYNVLANNVQFGETKSAAHSHAQPAGNYQPAGYAAQPSAVPQYGAVPAPNNNPYVQQQAAPAAGYGQQAAGYPAIPPQASQPAQDALHIGDLGEFEEILSDGEVPF